MIVSQQEKEMKKALVKNPDEVAARIRAVRDTTGLTQSQMADRLHIGVSQYAKVESAFSNLGGAAMALLCQLFGIRERWLLHGEGEMKDAPRPAASAVREPEDPIPYGAAARVRLEGDWPSHLARIFGEKRSIVEAGVNDYRLGIHTALRPVVDQFERELIERQKGKGS